MQTPIAPEPAGSGPHMSAPGAATAQMLLDASWVNRRKDAVRLLDDAWVHRQTSIDYTLTAPALPVGSSRGGLRWCIPLTLLGKVPRTLMRFDVFDEAGRRLTLPSRRTNALASYAAMCHAARVGAAEVIGVTGVAPELPVELREDLLYVAMADPERAAMVSAMLRTVGGYLHPPARPIDGDVLDLDKAETIVGRWESLLQQQGAPPETREAFPATRERELRDALADSDDFVWLVEKLALSSVLAIGIEGAPGQNKMLRLSYEESIYKQGEPGELQRFAALGWRAVPLFVHTPYAGAQSYHFEFEAPEDIEVVGSQLEDVSPVRVDPLTQHDQPIEDDDTLGQYDGDEPGSRYRFEPRRGGRVHLYAPNAELLDENLAQLRLRVRAQAFAGSATLAATGIGTLLAFYAIAAGPLVRDGTSATSLLLIFTGVFATIVGRAQGHAVVARMLRGARMVLLISVACSVAAASALVVTHTGSQTATAKPELRIYWGVLAAISLTCGAMLNLARILPRPRHRRALAERFVDGVELQWRRMNYRGHLRRQRDLAIVVEAHDETAQGQLDRIVAACSVGPKLRVKRHGNHLRVASEDAGRPITSRDAKRGDVLLCLKPPARQRLAATLAECDRRLPEGFAIVASWGSKVNELRAPTLVTSEQLQALIERDDVRLGTRYAIAPSDAS